MYYHAARNSHELAVQHKAEATKAEDAFKGLEAKEEAILTKYMGDQEEAYEELEPIQISMEDAHTMIGCAYAPLLRHLAVTHILATACLEAHINLRAKEAFVGRMQERFEMLPLDAKWLFMPKLLGQSGFDPGAQPFQDFVKLVKYRNALVHYKGRTEELRYGRAPSALEELGLTVDAASKSITVVPAMIQFLATQVGVDAPRWLDTNEASYFTFDIVWPDRLRRDDRHES